MRRRDRRSDEELTAALATREMMRSLLRRIPAATRQEAADEAMAIALGILHGCCGPHGDFSSDHVAPQRSAKASS